ncbi:MAG: MBL fold metallo-hydrolase [Candidatus Zixiibacteriota bacterium]|nr:MAG: MBL fold metallo-hydrolase [candidate division Zixibacteria bacterium]
MKINERCYVVYGLTMTPPWMVNSGFVVGDNRTLIIDSGGNYLSAQTIHGYAMVARPTNTLLVINTEPHSDHMGGNCLFRELGIDVYGHEGIDRNDDQLKAVKEGYNDAVPDAFRRTHHEGDLVFLHTRFVNPNMRFREDFTLDLGGFEIQVMMTPGHTPENASVYVPSVKTLYCGDTIVNGYVPNLTVGGVDDWHKWLKSLDRIERLALDTVVPGHGEVMGGGDIKSEVGRTRTLLEEAIQSGVAPTETG